MTSSGRKAKDDIIGGRDFSRVRRFDDEARKARIFAPNAGTSIDVKKLEDQLKEKERKRELDEIILKREETEQALEKETWDRADEELRKQRIQERTALEETWQRQEEEFKQRWKHEVSELNPDKVGVFPAKRYEFQDNEKVREGEAIHRISEAWRQQIEEHNRRMRMEQEEREKNNLEQDTARKNWERSHQEISKKLYNANVDLANEYIQLYKEKVARDRQNHYEEHLCGISEYYFKQFGTTSR